MNAWEAAVQFELDADATRHIYTIEQSRYPWLGVNGLSPLRTGSLAIFTAILRSLIAWRVVRQKNKALR